MTYNNVNKAGAVETFFKIAKSFRVDLFKHGRLLELCLNSRR